MQSLACQDWRVSLGRTVFVVAAIEVGLLLLTLPWSAVWSHTLWAAGDLPLWRQLALSAWVRGLLSGLGVLNLWAAASEITHFHL